MVEIRRYLETGLVGYTQSTFLRTLNVCSRIHAICNTPNLREDEFYSVYLQTLNALFIIICKGFAICNLQTYNFSFKSCIVPFPKVFPDKKFHKNTCIHKNIIIIRDNWRTIGDRHA